MTKEAAEQSVECDLDENWLPLLKTDGQWDEQKIRNELHDLVFIYHQVDEVYEHITNGKLSKPMYYADVIKQQFDEAINDAVKDAMADRLEEVGFLESRVRTLEAGLAEYGQHKDACEQRLLDAYMRTDPQEWICSCGLDALK